MLRARPAHSSRKSHNADNGGWIITVGMHVSRHPSIWGWEVRNLVSCGRTKILGRGNPLKFKPNQAQSPQWTKIYSVVDEVAQMAPMRLEVFHHKIEGHSILVHVHAHFPFRHSNLKSMVRRVTLQKSYHTKHKHITLAYHTQEYQKHCESVVVFTKRIIDCVLKNTIWYYQSTPCWRRTRIAPCALSWGHQAFNVRVHRGVRTHPGSSSLSFHISSELQRAD